MGIITVIKKLLLWKKKNNAKENPKKLPEETKISVDHERCVVCGSDTRYSHIVNVNNRCCYVPGGGQLCWECWNEIYSDNNRIWRNSWWEAE